MVLTIVAQTNIKNLYNITTDRNFYIVGESIKLNIFNKNIDLDYPTSEYLFCDLQGQDGKFYSGIKVRLDSVNIGVDLPIPLNIMSGNYLIRVYTLEMKAKPQSYSIQMVRILNPKNEAMLIHLDKASYKIKVDSLSKIEGVIMEGLAQTYSNRSIVECSLHISNKNIIPSSLSISVVPKLIAVHNTCSVVSNIDAYYSHGKGRGLLLNGQLLNTSKDDVERELSGNRIYFSIRGSRDILSCISDSGGIFQIYLPDNFGTHQIYITTETMLEDVQIKIKKAFDTQTTFQLEKDFYLTKKELDLALLIAQNNMVEKSFQQKEILNTKLPSKRPFYNKADEAIIINDYIELDDLSMYFTELPGNVHLHKRDGLYEMRIINPAGMQLYQAPLIMVDYVVVNDLQEVLKMNPKDINRIEIVSEYYYKGSAVFGGIVNFISNKNDFASYNFSNSSVSISYDFLTKKSEDHIYKPKVNTPDARTTLLWMNGINADNHNVDISFFTSDMKGEFSIIIQGLDIDGNPVFYSKDFIVE